MSVHTKFRQRPDQVEKAWRYTVSEAGLDYDNDWFNPPHVVRMIFDKGFEAGLSEAKRIAAKKAEQVTEPAE